RFGDCTHLHFENLGISDRKTAAAMTEHGVGFVELLDATGHNVRADAQFAGQFFLLFAIVRDKFVQRGVDEANGYRKTVHRLEDADEIAPLERKKTVESLHAILFGVGQNHFLDRTLALVALLRELKIDRKSVV